MRKRGGKREINTKQKFLHCLAGRDRGGYTVTVPSPPGCMTYGRTVLEARKMAEEASKLYVEALTSLGWLKERDLWRAQTLMTSVNVRLAS